MHSMRPYVDNGRTVSIYMPSSLDEVHYVNYFSDIPPRERLRYLKAVKGMEIDKGEALFHIGDAADAFYCVMYGSLNVVMDFAHMAVPTLNEFEEILSRARVHSSLLNPGGAQDLSQDANYVVRTLKPLECFGDVGLLLSDPHRTASVVANERTLLMKIDKDTFLDLRSTNIGRELREKATFLSSVRGFDHWGTNQTLKLCTRMEKVAFSYNDIVVREGELANYFYFVRHGECRFVKHFNLSQRPPPQDTKWPTFANEASSGTFVEICTVGSRHYVGAYEIVLGKANAVFSVLVSSPTAILYRVERLEFRHVALKDATTESLLKHEALVLSGRMDASSVAQELRVDATWEQYKRELVSAIRSKRHTQSPRLPPVAPAAVSIVSSSTCTSVRSPTRPDARSPRTHQNVQRRPSILVLNPSSLQRGPARDKKWLEWAKTRAHEIVTDRNGERLDPPDDQAITSNIHWGKTAKILGGLGGDDDKVTSVIVSLFTRSDDT
uniref:Cyclic nucleotide-binding domain-containing protein n=1 Tax=Globisporangium ultimum (strain ATCC 200006 / CBS 805.95 / DAOM BR144) TaxID=431595 RepID=K3WQ71_GLOUD